MRPTKVQQRARIAVVRLLQKNREVALSKRVVFAHEQSCPSAEWTELLKEALPDEDGYIMALAERPADADAGKVAISICGKKGVEHLQVDASSFAFDGEAMSMATRGFLYLYVNEANK